MQKADQDKYKAILRNIAQNISVLEKATVPVNISSVCSKYDVRIVKKICKDHKKPIVAYSDGRYQIQIPSDTPNSSEYSPSERLFISHELAHVLLDTKYQITPCDKSEYWQIEELCNYFAGNLLLPEQLISRYEIESYPADKILQLTFFLKNIAKSPWSTVAFRLSDKYPSVYFLRMQGGRDENKYSHKINYQNTRTLRVSMSTFPNKHFIHTKINIDSSSVDNAESVNSSSYLFKSEIENRVYDLICGHFKENKNLTIKIASIKYFNEIYMVIKKSIPSNLSQSEQTEMRFG